MFHHCRRRPTHFPVIRQSLRFVAELLQLYQTLMAVTLGSPQRRSRLLFYCCRRRPSLPSLSIAAIAIHHCRCRPSLPLPSNTLPSHSAIPKVGSRTPTIVPDTHSSYSRFPTAALTLIVPSLPSPSNALPSHSAIPKVGNGTPTVQTARLTVVQNVTSSNLPSLQEAPSRRRDG